MFSGGLSTSGQGREVSMATHEQEAPLQAAANWHCHTKPYQWKNTGLTPSYLPKGWTIWRGGRGWDSNCASLQIDLQRSAWIHEDSLKRMLNDLLRSARNWKDLQQEQQLICKGLYKPRVVTPTISKIKRFTNMQARSHASEEEVPNPCDHPASCHMRFGVICWPHKTQPVTSIGWILTLPKLHRATFNID